MRQYPPFRETYCVNPIPKCKVPALPPPGNECQMPTEQMICKAHLPNVCAPLPRPKE
jgi:hypothetical protein